jgi:hypothetical protein
MEINVARIAVCVERMEGGIERLNETASSILEAIPGKQSPFDRLIGTGAAIAGAVGILGVIDIVIKWVFGG